MTFEILYNESNGAVERVEVEASCLLEAEQKFKEAHPSAIHWEIGIEIGADFDFNSAPHQSAHYERTE